MRSAAFDRAPSAILRPDGAEPGVERNRDERGHRGVRLQQLAPGKATAKRDDDQHKGDDGQKEGREPRRRRREQRCDEEQDRNEGAATEGLSVATGS